MTEAPRIDADRLWRRLMALAEITEEDRPWTRRSFTPKFLEGREWLHGVFEEAKLETRVDAGGNLIGRRDGSSGNLAPLMLGSHSDTVPSGGRFDGTLGVLCAVEAAQTLAEAGMTTRHPLEIVDFLAEEPSEFGLSCIGSRALAGVLSPEMLDFTRPDGMTLAEGISYVGGDPDQLASVARGEGGVAGYLEVHIEQARALETAGIPVGVVTGIAAIRRRQIVIRGRTDHAGATPMGLRSDALVAASDFVSAVARAAAATGTPLVATVGRLEVRPNAANAVPGEVELILEARSDDPGELDRFMDSEAPDMLATACGEGFSVETTDISENSATPCDAGIIAAIEAAAEARGTSTLRMPSGAGHDAAFVGRTGPIGMIFAPCLDGRSHAPEEWANREDCATAAQVMLDALLRLDRQ